MSLHKFTLFNVSGDSDLFGATPTVSVSNEPTSNVGGPVGSLPTQKISPEPDSFAAPKKSSDPFAEDDFLGKLFRLKIKSSLYSLYYVAACDE